MTVTAAAPGAAALTATLLLAVTPAAAQAGSPWEAGKAAFEANCAVCHQASGAGNAALAPPLLTYPAKYAAIPEGRRQLAITLLYGLFGDVVVDGSHYNFKMPSFVQLDDETLAATLNYVVFDLAHAPASVTPFTAGDFKAERATSMSGAEVRAHRATVLQALGL